MKLALGLLFALVLMGNPKQPVQVVTTDKVEFASGGTIRLNGSVGQLNIEGWDRPEVEVTLTRYTYGEGVAARREELTKELNLIKATIQGQGTKELVITTQLPPRNAITRLFRGKTSWDVDYRIKVPRDSKLVARHDGGDLTVYDVAGDIEADDPHGSILLLVPDAQYSISARCTWGDIYSDFDGTTTRHVTGQSFVHAAPAGAHKLDVRVGRGGIKIQQMGPAVHATD